MQNPSRAAASALFVLLLAALLSGCASDRKPVPDAHRIRRETVPTLVGMRKFFDESIRAEVRIGAMPAPPRGDRATSEPAPGEAMRHRRRGGPGPARTEGPGGGGPGADRPRGLSRGGPSGPAVTIHLRFTNEGSQPVELVIADFLSPLGNFVVSPERLTLAPGQTLETEPMSSGLTRQLNDGDVTLKLRVGARQETGTVPLQVESPPSPESGNSGHAL